MIDRMATIRRGFLTSRSCGVDRLFEISIKFQSIEDLDAADQELRDALEREKAHEGPLVGDQIPVKNPQEEPRQQSGETGTSLGLSGSTCNTPQHPRFPWSEPQKIARQIRGDGGKERKEGESKP